MNNRIISPAVMVNWHRLFGLMLNQLFKDSPYKVELEKDLSLRQQFLDVVILKREVGVFTGKLPDGLENLSDFNLLSYKSLHEPFDTWTLKELVGHYVNYRKQISPDKKLLPEERFKLYGVCTRFPSKLNARIALKRIKPGVYELLWGVDSIRLIVLCELELVEHNVVWHLFSGVKDKVRYAIARWEMGNVSTILYQLFKNYKTEETKMSYTMHDFHRDFARENMGDFTPEERLRGLRPEERLRGLRSEEIRAYLEEQERPGLAKPDALFQ